MSVFLYSYGNKVDWLIDWSIDRMLPSRYFEFQHFSHKSTVVYMYFYYHHLQLYSKRITQGNILSVMSVTRITVKWWNWLNGSICCCIFILQVLNSV